MKPNPSIYSGRQVDEWLIVDDGQGKLVTGLVMPTEWYETARMIQDALTRIAEVEAEMARLRGERDAAGTGAR